MLPNPTIHHWDKKSFSMWKLLRAFKWEIDHNTGISRTDQILVMESNLDKIFTAKGDRGESDFTVAILDALHEALNDSDTYLTEKYVTTDLVLQVLRRHIQEVLSQINEGTSSGDNLFEELDGETPELKQTKFMHIYFNIVRPAVIEAVVSRPKSHPATGITTPSTEGGSPPGINHTPESLEGDRCNNIWCTLVFRMLCWLLLHDFHKKDVQISKSELVGSRLPVYIA
jgi:hypothetical protein